MKKCFVAMPFNEEFNKIYKYGIKKAVEDSGYECLRADELARGGNILSNIVRKINSSQLIIVDMTEQNANVMYELGLAHGLKKDTIIIVRDIKDVPFDLSAYHIITYDNPNDLESGALLQENIKNAIKSFEDKTQALGNPVIEYLSTEEIAPDPESYRQLKAELDNKDKEIIELKAHIKAWEPIIQKLTGNDKVEKEEALKTIKKRKYDFKYIGKGK